MHNRYRSHEAGIVYTVDHRLDTITLVDAINRTVFIKTFQKFRFILCLHIKWMMKNVFVGIITFLFGHV